jgi:hypothetical protein
MKQKVFSYLSKLPIGRWLKPVWKWALLQGVDPAMEWLGDQLMVLLEKGVGKAGKETKSIILAFEKKIVDHVKGSIIPDKMEEIVIARVISVCEQLNASVPVALDAGSVGAVRQRLRELLSSAGENLKNQIRAL